MTDAGDFVAGGLRAPRNRGNLLSHQLVQKGRFADVGLANEADVTRFETFRLWGI